MVFLVFYGKTALWLVNGPRKRWFFVLKDGFYRGFMVFHRFRGPGEWFGLLTMFSRKNMVFGGLKRFFRRRRKHWVLSLTTWHSIHLFFVWFLRVFFRWSWVYGISRRGYEQPMIFGVDVELDYEGGFS